MSSTQILETAHEQHPIIRRQIIEIEAELAKENPVITEKGRPMFEGEAARELLETILCGLKACDQLYDIVKANFAN